MDTIRKMLGDAGIDWGTALVVVGSCRPCKDFLCKCKKVKIDISDPWLDRDPFACMSEDKEETDDREIGFVAQDSKFTYCLQLRESGPKIRKVLRDASVYIGAEKELPVS